MEAMCDERAGDTKVRVKILKHVGYLQENLLRIGCCWLVALLLKNPVLPVSLSVCCLVKVLF